MIKIDTPIKPAVKKLSLVVFSDLLKNFRTFSKMTKGDEQMGKNSVNR